VPEKTTRGGLQSTSKFEREMKLNPLFLQTFRVL